MKTASSLFLAALFLATPVVAQTEAPATETPDESAAAQPEGSPEWMRRGVERVLSRLLETKVQVGNVSLDRENEQVRLEDLRIANPRGFSDRDAIRIETLDVETPLKKLLSREPLITDLRVKGAEVAAETTLRGSNLQTLQKSVQKARSGPLLRAREKVWQIERLSLADSVVLMNAPFVSQRRASLDQLDLDYVGERGRPVTAQEAVAQVLQELVRKAELVTDEQPDAERPTLLDEVIKLF